MNNEESSDTNAGRVEGGPPDPEISVCPQSVDAEGGAGAPGPQDAGDGGAEPKSPDRTDRATDDFLKRLDNIVREFDREADYLEGEMREAVSWMRKADRRSVPRGRTDSRRPRKAQSAAEPLATLLGGPGGGKDREAFWEEYQRRYPHLMKLLTDWPRAGWRAKVGMVALIIEVLSEHFDEWGKGPFRGVRQPPEKSRG